MPEAQMDRFLMHGFIGYTDEVSEAKIVELVRSEESGGKAKSASDAPEPIPQDAIFEARTQIPEIHVSDAIEKYGVDLVFATRYPERYSEDLRK